MASSVTRRRHYPVDYDNYAPTYAWARFAVPWVLEPLVRSLREAPAGAGVLEIGCGTGNYLRALSSERADSTFVGVDRSRPMLQEARRTPADINYLVGDAALALPFATGTFLLAFAVDVIHHIADVTRFFQEASRVLQPGGRLTLVTDSEDTFRRRSLTAYFPELLSIELDRYPAISLLNEKATLAGFRLSDYEQAMGEIDLSDDFLARLESKCSSAMRLITAFEHAAGMERVRAAQGRGEKWLSIYEVLQYTRVD